MEEAGITHGEKPKTDDTKDKKYVGVDHSGFGGHGSHKNKSRKNSKDESAVDHKTVPGSDTDKKGIVEKIKEKMHHSSDK